MKVKRKGNTCCSRFFPYAVLTALAVRGLTMPGAADGIAFLFSPKWQRLADPQIWTDAATQGS